MNSFDIAEQLRNKILEEVLEDIHNNEKFLSELESRYEKGMKEINWFVTYRDFLGFYIYANDDTDASHKIDVKKEIIKEVKEYNGCAEKIISELKLLISMIEDEIREKECLAES